MEMPSSITSPHSSTASLSSLSLASSGLFHTGTPHRPSAPKMKAMAVEFWYEDDSEDPVPAAAERFSCGFLEECRLCKRRLGAGRDAYMFGGEAAFCSEECRQEWMELLETSSDEKIRRRTVAAVKACRSSRIPAAAEMYSAAAQYRGGGALVAG